MRRVFFDESGNTGENLIDQSQPLYCLTSLEMSDEHASTLLSLITSESHEKHFITLKRKPVFQNQILQLLNHDLVTEENLKYCISLKEYVLIGHMVDRFIEPLFYDMGLDIYRGGLNINFTNGIFYCGLVRWDKRLYYELLQALQNLIRKQTDIDVKCFYDAVQKLLEKYPDDEKFLLPILLSKNQITSIIDGLHKNVIDMALTSFIPLCDAWGRSIGNFDVFHDDSKQIEFWREWINYFSSSQKFNNVEVGFDSRKIIYPLSVNDLILVDSIHVKQIQIADIIGSAITYSLKKIVIEKDLNDDFANKIHKSKVMQFPSYGLWPHTEVKKYPIDPKEKNPLDHLVEINENNSGELAEIYDRLKRKQK